MAHSRKRRKAKGPVEKSRETRIIESTAEAVDLAARRKQCLELRKAGHTYLKIAEMVGYASVSSAYDAVHESIKAIIREPAEEIRLIEVERLDRLIEVWWPLLETSGREKATEFILKVMARRAKLMGLDMTEPVVTNNVIRVIREDRQIMSASSEPTEDSE